jgi:hypothetical protein
MRQPITNAEIAYPYDWCIAGGFAACPDLASDCDVWVYGIPTKVGTHSPEHPAWTFRQSILWRLQNRNVAFEEEQNNMQFHDWYDIGDGVLCWKVARLADGRQIILTDADSIDALLDRFDVSTHQVALSSDGEIVRGSHFTPITKPAKMIRDGGNTAQRMQKVQQRYSLLSADELRLMEDYKTWVDTDISQR